MNRRRIVPIVTLALASCAAPAELEAPSIEGWVPETFPLPPAFAPALPPGEESVLFPPEFRNPQSEQYWSYAFVVWMDEPIPDAASLDDWLEAYYDGLMSAVAAAEGKDVGDDAAQVQVQVEEGWAGTFEATMHVIDAFGTFQPMDVRLLITREAAERTVLRVQASPQPRDHEIWRYLGAAITSLGEP